MSKAPRKAKLRSKAAAIMINQPVVQRQRRGATASNEPKTETNPYILNPKPMSPILAKSLLHPLTHKAIQTALKRKEADPKYDVARRIEGRSLVDPILAHMLKTDPKAIRKLTANSGRFTNQEISDMEEIAQFGRTALREMAISDYANTVIRRGIVLIGPGEREYGKFLCQVVYGYAEENIDALRDTIRVKVTDEVTGETRYENQTRINVDKELPRDLLKFKPDELQFDLAKAVIELLRSRGYRVKLTKLEYSTPYVTRLPFRTIQRNSRLATHAIFLLGKRKVDEK